MARTRLAAAQRSTSSSRPGDTPRTSRRTTIASQPTTMDSAETSRSSCSLVSRPEWARFPSTPALYDVVDAGGTP